MLVVFFTNCQGNFIYKNWLKNISFFENTECVFIHNYNCSLNNNDINYFKQCDILIYQPVDKYTLNENDIIISLLKPNCIKICFPSIYVDMWPIYEENNMYVGGTVINEYKKKYNLDKILELYDNQEFCFNLQNRFDTSLQYLQNKEDNYCNIKISNFIVTNYRKYKMFDTQNHPNGIIGSYIANEICKHLNITFTDIDFFSQGHIGIGDVYWRDSLYMKNELNLEFIFNDDKIHYRNLIIKLYNNPELIKIKYL